MPRTILPNYISVAVFVLKLLNLSLRFNSSAAVIVALVQVGNLIVRDDMHAGVLSSKDLEPAREQDHTAAEYHEFCSSWAEAQWVCEKIRHMHDVEKRRWEDFAILTRCVKQNMIFSGGDVLRHLKEELTKHGVPHRVTRGKSYASAAPTHVCFPALA